MLDPACTLLVKTCVVACTVGADTCVTAVTLAADTLPDTVTRLDALSNVNPADPAKISPSLNCTWVLAPPASTLPVMLPTKLVAVILPVTDRLPKTLA